MLSLKRLPLGVLASLEEGELPPAVEAGLSAPIARSTIRLCFVTRSQAARLAPLELELLSVAGAPGAAHAAALHCPAGPEGSRHNAGSTADAPSPAAPPPPSILRGCFVRFVYKGAYRVARVAQCVLDDGKLALWLQGFDRLVPIHCLSNSDSLGPQEAWEAHGRQELRELSRALAAAEALPGRREIAAACCRLSTGWLWAAQLPEFREALRRDAAAVAKALEDPLAVLALLPCVGQHSSRVRAGGSAGGAGSPGAPSPGAAVGTACTRRREEPPAKRQRVGGAQASGAASGSPPQEQERRQQPPQPPRGDESRPEQSPREDKPRPEQPPRGDEPRPEQQQQQQQQPAPPPGPPVLLPPPPPTPGAPGGRVPHAVLPPGGRLELLLLRALEAAGARLALLQPPVLSVSVDQRGRQQLAYAPPPPHAVPCTLDVLGQQLVAMHRGWRGLSGGFSLKDLATELCLRGLMAPGPQPGSFKLMAPVAAQVAQRR